MDVEKRFELITRNVKEVITRQELLELLEEKKKPVVYWGTAPTGKPHVAYLFPILKISDFLKAGFKVKILIADIHAALDNTPWELLDYRFKYYKKTVELMIKTLGVKSDMDFVRGSDFQLEKDYIFDVLKLSSFVSIRDAKKAASDVVKFGDNPKLSGLIYPLMQALDEEYLGVDIQFGGVDQRKIMVLAREFLPKIGYKRRVEIMNPLIPGLIGEKMSASDEKSKIDFLDSDFEVLKKIKNAEMVKGNPNNGIMAFLKYVIFPLKKDKKESFVVRREKKYGGDVKYEDYERLEEDYVVGKIHPLDVKISLADEINKLLSIFRKEKNRKELENLSSLGWPN